MIPVQFFQVTAAAIPTLVIAMAVGAKQGQLMADSFARSNGSGRFLLVFFSVIVFALVFAGEWLSLRALIWGNGEKVSALIIYCCIALLLYLVCWQFIFPIKEFFSEGQWSLLELCLALGALGSIIAMWWFVLDAS